MATTAGKVRTLRRTTTSEKFLLETDMTADRNERSVTKFDTKSDNQLSENVDTMVTVLVTQQFPSNAEVVGTGE